MNPNLAFLLKHPSHFVALGFGSGLSPKAPGTAGTLVAFPLFMLLTALTTSSVIQLVVIAILFVIGVSLCTQAGNALGVSDHGSIVWDEIVAMMLVLVFTPLTWLWWTVAFALFRLFDIWKPFPIRQCDAKLKGGFGVMFDDLLAAIYAVALIIGLQCLVLN